MLLVIDHKHGNIGSLVNALEFVGFDYKIVEAYNGSYIKDASGFILPGVGSFDSGMTAIRERGLDDLVKECTKKGIKGLGICLGMQMLCDSSEESIRSTQGLKLIPGSFKLLNSTDGFVPSIGWQRTMNVKDGTRNELLNGSFYYVHSYGYHHNENTFILARYGHGSEYVVGAIGHQNLLGVQFHPEKSQEDGLDLLKSYFSNKES